MATYAWGLVCQQVIVDKYTNSASYLNAVEELTPAELPAEMPNLFVGTLWRRENEEEDFYFRVVVEDDNGGLLHTSSEDHIHFEQNHERYRVNQVIGGVEVEEPGTLWYCVEKKEDEDEDWSREASLPVDISKPQ